MDSQRPVVRRKKTFPVTFVITPPTRTEPRRCEMYYADEFAAFQAAKAAQEACPEPDECINDAAEQPAIEAEPNEASADLALSSEPRSDAPSSGLLSSGGRSLSSDITPALSSEVSTPEDSSSGGRSFSSGVTASSLAGVLTPEAKLPPDFARHARKCRICSHPDRDAIEGDFIRWRSPELIAKDHQISDRTSASISNRQIRILEAPLSCSKQTTAPRSNRQIPRNRRCGEASRPSPQTSRLPLVLIDTHVETESVLTHRKQTTAPRSNRYKSRASGPDAASPLNSCLCASVAEGGG